MKCIYRLFINPLHKYLGLKFAAVTRFPHLYHTLKGDNIEWIQYIHNSYGNSVRIAPDELSYTTGEAWRGIYGDVTVGRIPTIKYQVPQFVSLKRL